MKNPTYPDEKTTGNKQSNTKHIKIAEQSGWRLNPRLRSADMDIVQAFTNKRFNEENKARGVNPISVGDQNNGLGSVYGLRSIGNRGGRRGLGGFNIVAFF